MSVHPDPESLAELAEGTLERDAARALREHLAACRPCTAAYVDAVRYRAAWLARPELFARAPEAARRVLALRRARRRERWPHPGRVVAAVAAGLVIAFAAALTIELAGRAPMTHLALTPAVLAASERSSSLGLVLPGGERLADRPAPAYRAGFERPRADLEREVDGLVEHYERGDRSPAQAARVIEGLLAIDDLEAARAYAREALRNLPDDVTLLACAAVASYRSNDLAGAEQSLRRAQARAPGDPVVSLDLGLVLRARGSTRESAALLARAARGPSAPVAARAARELSAPSAPTH